MIKLLVALMCDPQQPVHLRALALAALAMHLEQQQPSKAEPCSCCNFEPAGGRQPNAACAALVAALSPAIGVTLSSPEVRRKACSHKADAVAVLAASMFAGRGRDQPHEDSLTTAALLPALEDLLRCCLDYDPDTRDYKLQLLIDTTAILAMHCKMPSRHQVRINCLAGPSSNLMIKCRSASSILQIMIFAPVWLS